MEWWTYRPSDFLMFSPRIYWRLFESINQAWWPAQLALVGLPLAWLAARLQPRFRWTQTVALPALFLASCWAIVAWDFHHQRFAPINWIADAYAAAFGLAAMALAALAAVGKLRSQPGRTRAAVALVLALFALAVYPLVSGLAGRPWQQAEVFGLAPDPTAIGTLGFLLLLKAESGLTRWLCWVVSGIAIAWCVVSAATLATMESMQALVLLSAVMVTLIALREEA